MQYPSATRSASQGQKDLLARVDSNAKLSLALAKSLMRAIMIRPAANAARSGSNPLSPFAMTSALTKCSTRAVL